MKVNYYNAKLNIMEYIEVKDLPRTQGSHYYIYNPNEKFVAFRCGLGDCSIKDEIFLVYRKRGKIIYIAETCDDEDGDFSDYYDIDVEISQEDLDTTIITTSKENMNKLLQNKDIAVKFFESQPNQRKCYLVKVNCLFQNGKRKQYTYRSDKKLNVGDIVEPILNKYFYIGNYMNGEVVQILDKQISYVANDLKLYPYVYVDLKIIKDYKIKTF